MNEQVKQILIDEIVAWRLYHQMRKDPSKMSEKKRKSIIYSTLQAVTATDKINVLPEKVKS